MNDNFLRDNPIFWSRLGFCYDPPLENAAGKPLVFDEDFEKYAAYHKAFADIGVTVHSCILHAGWVGVDKYDYSLTDSVLDTLMAVDAHILFIPRIKLNVPIDWCAKYPEELFGYYGGPVDREEIRAMVGTPLQDYLGYESEIGYYNANGGFRDTRPNVGGMIARQSFASRQWLADASAALEKLLAHIAAGPYADRIIAYHICYGASGENMLWGRSPERYGDYGICFKRALLAYGLEKYGSHAAMQKAWGVADVSENALVLPSPDARYSGGDRLRTLFRADDALAADMDDCMTVLNTSAITHFAKITKETTGKLVGTFYGYYHYVHNAAYTGHVAIEHLLQSPYVDFIAAPKGYEYIGSGEPGCELCPALSVNRKKLWADETDVRTYLAKEAGKAADMTQTRYMLWREFCKDVAHNSAFWWMDLGDGWYNDAPIMHELQEMMAINARVRETAHIDSGEILVLSDETCMLKMQANEAFHDAYLRTFVPHANSCGTVVDTYRLTDLDELDLARYKCIMFAYCFEIKAAQWQRFITRIGADTLLLFNSCCGIWNERGFDVAHTAEITGFAVADADYHALQVGAPLQVAGLPAVRRADGGINVLNLQGALTAETIRAVATYAGCHMYTDFCAALYGDNRVFGIFPQKAVCGALHFKTQGNYRDVATGTVYRNTDTIEVSLAQHEYMVLEALTEKSV